MRRKLSGDVFCRIRPIRQRGRKTPSAFFFYSSRCPLPCCSSLALPPPVLTLPRVAYPALPSRKFSSLSPRFPHEKQGLCVPRPLPSRKTRAPCIPRRLGLSVPMFLGFFFAFHSRCRENILRRSSHIDCIMAVYRRYLRQGEGFGAFSAFCFCDPDSKKTSRKGCPRLAGAPAGRFFTGKGKKATAQKNIPSPFSFLFPLKS